MHSGRAEFLQRRPWDPHTENGYNLASYGQECTPPNSYVEALTPV